MVLGPRETAIPLIVVILVIADGMQWTVNSMLSDCRVVRLMSCEGESRGKLAFSYHIFE